MKINNFKKKCLISSLLLLFTGFIISLSGFCMTGFSSQAYAEENGHRWYQTIYMDNNEWAYGVQLSENTSILKIGGEEFVLFVNVD